MSMVEIMRRVNYSPFTCDFIDDGGCDDDDTIDQAMRLTWAGLQVICY